ncbi:NADP-dependent oxidoreductase [Streptomyces spinosirectus]|jgi:NADPH:quinone reductase-like Zn-dependent oxidoreductase|uniref:NADP-dependent oxidoreductase n=1 Tax=Streptomyces TaxID=1883 RepID=UPI001C9DC733|nr:MULTISPECIES: NADP-dependent oxidoreductase [Streptomyces]MBY8344964.1 NADP-dependent oxidoreductase [Streptomyces plumbidurans]UIR20757.1 NADP-dependent oxidoreductase [Streptomyces spinosirectus]
MKAVRFHEYGDSSVLAQEEVATPQPGSGQVLVKVAATSFNPADAALRSGFMREFIPVELPYTTGVDLAGTVAAVGPDVTGWAEGARVAAFLPLASGGAAAEYALAPADILAAVPDGVDLVAAAALPGTGLTAWQALFEHGGVQPGQRVLVNGAGGAVGGYAVQLAKHAGAEVTAVAGSRSLDRVRVYGADHVVDYTATPVTEAAKGPFDLVLHFARSTPEEADALARLVADSGSFVTGTTPPGTGTGRGVKVIRMAVRSDATQLTRMFDLAASGALRINVADRRPLADIADVHEEAAQGRLAGKTVLIL